MIEMWSTCLLEADTREYPVNIVSQFASLTLLSVLLFESLSFSEKLLHELGKKKIHPSSGHFGSLLNIKLFQQTTIHGSVSSKSR